MSRFLFVMPPLVGHMTPASGVATELRARGHAVAWVTLPGILHSVPSGDEPIYPYDAEAFIAALREPRGWRDLRGVPALQFLWERFIIPLAHTMLPAVRTAAAEFVPDVVVSDQQALAGAAVARREGIAWATSAAMSAELVRPLETVPKVRDWVDGIMAAFATEVGVTGGIDLRFSDQLVLCFSTPELVGSSDFPPHYLFPGPSLLPREVADFPWGQLDPDRPHILVTLGTLTLEAGRRFFGVAVEALAGDYQLVIAARSEMLPDWVGDAICRPFVPQMALLDGHIDAMVCHAGHNTVCEALAFGVPLVVAPVHGDQPVTAQQVADAGAGIRVRFGRLSAPELRKAVDEVMANPSYRAAARRIAASFAAAGGASLAARHLEALAGRARGGATG